MPLFQLIVKSQQNMWNWVSDQTCKKSGPGISEVFTSPIISGRPLPPLLPLDPPEDPLVRALRTKVSIWALWRAMRSGDAILDSSLERKSGHPHICYSLYHNHCSLKSAQIKAILDGISWATKSKDKVRSSSKNAALSHSKTLFRERLRRRSCWKRLVPASSSLAQQANTIYNMKWRY